MTVNTTVPQPASGNSSAPAPEWEAARLRAYRQARIFEPNMESYYAAMAVYSAAFGKPDGELSVVFPDGSAKQAWELFDVAASGSQEERVSGGSALELLPDAAPIDHPHEG